ncbi:hypothetical protein [Cylindrospermum sp. FACHB-282]|uniref:hypothetical protein n=1 Tax=Cylindrospermum sp. FACHB-282 TaxID=2692794 RepID=UPI0016823106|nr:hypothetical protein [Cylindrospermum sp. FACHB-282]MBD2386439.1 hypothetical protein [Cylindrospermum sp. FACHB-282]
MKISNKLLHLMSGKACKIAKYHNIAICILTAILLPCTTTASLGYTNKANIRTFDSVTEPSSAGNITPIQILSKAPTILVADASNSSESDILITSFREGFDMAWQKKKEDREKSLFTICNIDNDKYMALLCLDVLELYLNNKISSWDNECYKQKTNLVLCLGFLGYQGTTRKDLELWIEKSDILRQKIIDEPT